MNLTKLLEARRALKDTQFAFAGMPESFVQERRTKLEKQAELAGEAVLADLRRDPFTYVSSSSATVWVRDLQKDPKAEYQQGPTPEAWIIRKLPVCFSGFEVKAHEEYNDETHETIWAPTYTLHVGPLELGSFWVTRDPDVYGYRFALDEIDDKALRTYLEEHLAAIREDLRANPFETQILMSTAGALADVIEAEVHQELKLLVYLTSKLYWLTTQT